jgi:hypothetical protein
MQIKIRNTGMNKTMGLAVICCALFARHAHATDMPDIKEGLWESNTMIVGVTPKPMHGSMCTSSATNKRFRDETQKNPNRPCKNVHSELKGSVYTEEIECTRSGQVTRTKTITTFTGNTAYHTETHKADNTVEAVIDVKYVGACPAGMQLGDVVGSDGTKINMLNFESPKTPPSKSASP